MTLISNRFSSASVSHEFVPYALSHCAADFGGAIRIVERVTACVREMIDGKRQIEIPAHFP